tara:strand:- start:418 stop:741 length:324 start_codon:yes stop_codon:yes gene_type:complete
MSCSESSSIAKRLEKKMVGLHCICWRFGSMELEEAVKIKIENTENCKTMFKNELEHLIKGVDLMFCAIKDTGDLFTDDEKKGILANINSHIKRGEKVKEYLRKLKNN